MFKLVPFVVLLSLTLTACAGALKRPPAEDRARRLNAEKRKAEALVEAGLYQEAISVLKTLSKEASADHQLFSMLARSYAGLGRFEDAVAAYETAIRISYSDYFAHLELATLLMKHGKTGRALTEFELAQRFGAQDPVTHYNYGLALFELGRRDEALDHYLRAFDIENDNADYAQAVGMALSGKDDSRAIGYFETAARLGADDGGFHNNFGLALQRAGQLDRAATQFEAAVSLSPDNEAYWFNLAALHMSAGAFEDAVEVWDSLIEREGPRWSYLVFRGDALFRLARFAEAIASVEPIAGEVASGALAAGSERLDRSPPGLNHAFEILAMSYRGAGDVGKALNYIRRAVELEPLNVSHLNNYGVILAESGRIDEAKAQWRKVLEIDSGNTTARDNLSAVER